MSRPFVTQTVIRAFDTNRRLIPSSNIFENTFRTKLTISRMSSKSSVPDEKKPITAYDPHSFPEKFDQSLPGSDRHMDPLAQHTKIEDWDENGEPFLKEYKGSGKLDNKKVIITGGDSGIGRSVAIFMAREGADLTIGFLSEERHDAEDTVKLIEPTGRKVVLVEFDQRSEEECEKLVRKHVEAYGRIDVLVNNASKQEQCKDLKNINVKTVQDTFQVNIVGMIQLTKHALPHMKRGGAIVNSSSVTAYKGSGGMLDYSATKGAIVAFTRSLAAQQMSNGIKVNTVAPGPVYTPLQPASRSAEQMEDWGVGEIPLRGRVAQPAELGAAYVFAASADSNFMTGTTIHVNGGQHTTS